MNEDLPTFVVMNAEKSHPRSGVQAISAKLWSAGFLSPEYAGHFFLCDFRGDPNYSGIHARM